MLSGVYITDSDGNIGMVRSSVENVCGMIFDISKQVGFPYEHTDEVLELTKQKAAVELDLQKFRCIRQKCSSREPQNGY